MVKRYRVRSREVMYVKKTRITRYDWVDLHNFTRRPEVKFRRDNLADERARNLLGA